MQNRDDKYPSIKNALFPVEETLGVMMHHDAISGTSPKSTAVDYLKMLLNSQTDLKNKLKNLI